MANPGDYARLIHKNLEEALNADSKEPKLQSLIKQAEQHPFFNLGLREGIYKDYAQALGMIHDIVVDAAVPELIGREIINVLPVKRDPVRFIKAAVGKAWKTGEAPAPVTPETYSAQNVSAYEVKAAAEWTQSFLEDAEWNVEQRFVAECGRSVAQFETEDIIALYNNISSSDLAGGNELTIASPITWQNFTALITRVRNANWHPNVVAVSETVYGELLSLDQFVSSLYHNPEKNIRTGVISTTLGVDVVHSSLITKSLAIDTRVAAVMTLRRDLTTKPYENPAEDKYGVSVTERYGLAVLRANAVARGSR